MKKNTCLTLILVCFTCFFVEAQETEKGVLSSSLILKEEFKKDSIKVVRHLESVFEDKDSVRKNNIDKKAQGLKKLMKEFGLEQIVSSVDNNHEIDFDSPKVKKQFEYLLKIGNVIDSFIKGRKNTSTLDELERNTFTITDEDVKIVSDSISDDSLYEKDFNEANIQNEIVDEKDNLDLNCEFNFNEALFYLEGDSNFKRDTIKAIDYLKPCVEKDDAKAQLLLAKIFLAKKTEEYYSKAYELLKKSSAQGNHFAMVELGVMYKYGRGCRLNYNKARRWFKKSAELGNDKASYSLGYLYLKGFGSISQSYTKAIKWFEKSEHPMAKYWLGVCYYNGYGVNKDEKKANDFFKDEFEVVSLSNSNIVSDKDDDFVNKVLESCGGSNKNNDVENTVVQETVLSGEWKGKLIKLDWSGNHMEEKLGCELKFITDSISGITKLKIILNGKTIEDTITRVDNAIHFNNLEINLPHKTYTKEIPSELPYQFLSSELKIKSFKGSDYLVGFVDSYINKWSESGSPLRFVLKRKENFEGRDKEIPNEILERLSNQGNNFIQLYPNPFENDLVISYTLKHKANVRVQIHSLTGNLVSTIENLKVQQKGRYRYFFDASHLNRGVYVVSVFVNNERKTRITIKK